MLMLVLILMLLTLAFVAFVDSGAVHAEVVSRCCNFEATTKHHFTLSLSPYPKVSKSCTESKHGIVEMWFWKSQMPFVNVVNSFSF